MEAIKLLTSIKCGGIKRLSKETLIIGEDISKEDASFFIDNGVAVPVLLDKTPEKTMNANPLFEMNTTELKALCAKQGISGYANLKKAELIELLNTPILHINLDDIYENALIEFAKEEKIEISEGIDVETMRELIAHELGI